MNSTTPTATTKHFSTSARVHPSYLPYLQSSSSLGKSARAVKWLPPVLAVAYGANYAVSTLREMKMQSEQETQAEMRRRQLMLDDAYGDRTSLEGLEKAMLMYESQRPSQ